MPDSSPPIRSLCPPLRSLCRLHCVPLRHTLPSPLCYDIPSPLPLRSTYALFPPWYLYREVADLMLSEERSPAHLSQTLLRSWWLDSAITPALVPLPRRRSPGYVRRAA